MSVRNNVVHLIEVFAKVKGVSPSSVTTQAMGSGHVYQHLVLGGNITLDRVERAIHWFDANWPDGAVWPEGLVRPSELVA